MRYALCNEMFQGWEWSRMCEFARSLGYTGFEVAPFTLADSADLVTPAERKRLRDEANARGVEVLGLHWLLVKPAGLYMTHPDPAIRKRTADYFVSLVHLCADLGAEVLVSGSQK